MARHGRRYLYRPIIKRGLRSTCPSEEQRFYFGSQSSPVASSLVESGTFTLTYDGQTTSAINYNDSAAIITAALEALSNIGPSDVLITTQSNGFTVNFQAGLGNIDVALMTLTPSSLMQKADTISVSTTTSGVAPDNEIQNVSFGGATTGSFDLNGNATSATINTFTDGGIQTACDAIWGVGNTSVSSNNVTFQGSFAATNVAEMTVTNNTTDGSPSVSTTTNGTAGVAQVVEVLLSSSPTEGTLYVTLGGNSSGDFNYNDASPGAITGWTGGGSAGNWTYTANSPAANEITTVGSEGATPLRKTVSAEIVLVTSGGCGAGGAISGPSALVFGGTGGLLGSGALLGSAALLFGGTNSLTGSGTLTGSSAIIFAGTDTLLGSGALTGSSAITFAGTDTLLASGALLGSAALTFGGTDTLLGSGSLAGSSALAFDGTDTLTASGSLAGTSDLVLSGTNSLLGSGSLAGSSALVYAGTNTLLASGSLAGSAALTFTNSATFEVSSTLAGSVALTFGGTNTLRGSGSLSGSAASVFCDPVVATNEIQDVLFNGGTSGSLLLTEPYTSGVILIANINNPLADAQAGFMFIGTVSLISGGLRFTYDGGAPYSNADMPTLVVSLDMTNGSGVTVVTRQHGTAGLSGLSTLTGTGALLGSSTITFANTGNLLSVVPGVGSFENVGGPFPVFPYVSGSLVFQVTSGSNSGTFPIVKTKG